MNPNISIKNKNIGSGKPIICIPVTRNRKEDIINEIKLLSENKVEMIEWRIDFFDKIENEDEIRSVISQVKPYLKEVIFLVTFRSDRQGGNGNLTEAKYKDLLVFLSKQETIDFVDVECVGWNAAKEMVSLIKKNGRKVIASHHNFNKTPEQSELFMYFEEMNETNADILKLAVMPKEDKDVFELLLLTKMVQNKYTDKVIVTMSMGKMGMITRFLGEIYNSAITFGLNQVASAPGQMPYTELEKLLNIIHEILKEQK